MNLLEARKILKDNGYYINKLNECGAIETSYGGCGRQDSGCGGISFYTPAPSHPRLKKGVKEQIISTLEEFGISDAKFYTTAGETEVSFTKNNEKCKLVFKLKTGELSGLWVNNLLLMCRDRLPTNNELKTLADLKSIFKSLRLFK